MLGLEVKVALNGKAKPAMGSFKLAQTDAVKLGAAETKVVGTKGDVGLFGIGFGKKQVPAPSCWKTFTTGKRSMGIAVISHPLSVLAPFLANCAMIGFGNRNVPLLLRFLVLSDTKEVDRRISLKEHRGNTFKLAPSGGTSLDPKARHVGSADWT